MRITSLIKDGKLDDKAEELFKEVLQKLDGKNIEIKIDEKKRSLAQNRYRFGVVIDTIRAELNKKLRANGLPEASPEDIDLFIKRHALGISEVIKTSMGEIIIQGKLKNKNTKEFEKSMEVIRAWAAERGIIVPLPNEEELEKWYQENEEYYVK